jgi:hypothetical protein
LRRDDSNRGGDLAAWFGFPGDRAPLLATLAAILGTCPERGVVRRVGGGPRARERVSNGGCGEAPACWFCFRLGVLHAVRWSAWVQQHCGVRSCTAVALFGAVVPAPLLLIGGGLLLRSDTCGPAGGSCGCFLSPVSALCVVAGRVDDPIRPASEFLQR